MRYIAAAIHRVEPVSPDVFDALSGPGGSTWAEPRPASRGCSGRTRASPGARARRPAPRRQPVLSGRARGARPVRSDRLGDRGCEQGGAGTAAGTLADERAGPRDRRGRPPARRAGGRVAAGSCRSRARCERPVRPDRADGRLACRPVPRGAVDADGGGRLAGRRRLQRRRPVRVRVLPRGAAVTAARPRRRPSSSTRRCWSVCPAGSATPCSRRRGRHTRSTRSSARTASSCDWTGGASGIATTTCSVSCCGTSSSGASRTWWPSSTVARWPGASPTTCPRRRSSTGSAAGDAETVAGLVDALALPVYFDGRQETVEEWLGWFGEDELSQYPALAVYGAWIRVLTGRPEEAEHWLALADGATSKIPLSDGSATIEPWVATLRAYMMRDGVEQALADADLALDQLPAASGWFPVALLGRGLAHALLGATDRARDDLTAAVERGLPVGSVQTRLCGTGTALATRGRTGSLGRGRTNMRGPRLPSSRSGASATTQGARSRTSRRHASHSTREDRTMRAPR